MMLLLALPQQSVGHFPARNRRKPNINQLRMQMKVDIVHLHKQLCPFSGAGRKGRRQCGWQPIFRFIRVVKTLKNIFSNLNMYNKYLDELHMQIFTTRHLSFRSVVVITCASHAQGRRFEPGRKQDASPFCARLTLRIQGVSRPTTVDLQRKC